MAGMLIMIARWAGLMVIIFHGTGIKFPVLVEPPGRVGWTALAADVDTLLAKLLRVMMTYAINPFGCPFPDELPEDEPAPDVALDVALYEGPVPEELLIELPLLELVEALALRRSITRSVTVPKLAPELSWTL